MAQSADDSVFHAAIFFCSGQAGALSVVGPGFHRSLNAETPAAPALDRALAVHRDLTDISAQQLANLSSGLRWRMLGPFRGGRVDAVCGVPGRPGGCRTFGAVNGGVWKSIDAGRVWTPVFDSQPVASIGAIAVAPSAPDVVYVGSGESTLRDSMGYGNGMYKSATRRRQEHGRTSASTTRQHIRRIARSIRRIPEIVFRRGDRPSCSSSDVERGVFEESTDGGKSWKKVLFKDENTGAVEVVIDPTNSNVIYAGLWNTRRPPMVHVPSSRTERAARRAYYSKSTDGGATWKQLTNEASEIRNRAEPGIAVSAGVRAACMQNFVDCLEPDTTAPAAQTAPPGGGRGGAAARVQSAFFRSDDAV